MPTLIAAESLGLCKAACASGGVFLEKPFTLRLVEERLSAVIDLSTPSTARAGGDRPTKPGP